MPDKHLTKAPIIQIPKANEIGNKFNQGGTRVSRKKSPPQTPKQKRIIAIPRKGSNIKSKSGGPKPAFGSRLGGEACVKKTTFYRSHLQRETQRRMGRKKRVSTICKRKKKELQCT